MSIIHRVQRGHYVAIAIGLAIGIFSFFILFGPERAIGDGDAYRWPAGDQAQHIAGAYAYLDGAWSFPIFHTDRINAPDGVNIIFTDSAPFAGLLAKAIHSLTGWRFNYLGTWFAILWIGQATAGAYLVRQMGLNHPVFQACGAIFALAWPPFLNRHFHLALGSHFLLIFALGLYFRTVREAFSTRGTVLWALLLGVAVWIHAYLFLMCLTVFIAAYGDALLRRHIGWRHALLTVAGVVMWCVGLALIGGYQTVGAADAGGYGAFRLDLLAYVWPHGSAILQAPVIFDPQSAFEGFNYLGLGGIFTVLAALPFIRKRHLAWLSGHSLLILCVLGMLAFAITNSVAAGGHQIFHIPIPIDRFPFSTFRASGRFGWAFGYLVVFGALAFLVSTLESRSRSLAMVVAVGLTLLQAVDSTLMLKGMQQGWRAEAKPVAEEMIVPATAVHFAPPIDCLADGPVQKAEIEVLAIAAKAGKKSDSAHTARGGALECNSQPKEVATGEVVIAAASGPQADFYRKIMACREESGLLLCRGPRP